MKDRIKQYIEQKGISAGELAVMLDVQRSNISHILNGRNKPGASFIEKLLLTFPDLNARWLLTGAGQMIEGVETPVQKNETLPFKPAVEVEEPVEVKHNPAKKVQPEETSVNPEEEDTLDRLVVLYKDGTFTTFKKR
ncbi:helix-turn-helix transcriptional regulator [uncultured Draconibacterium sp.]|uniref:helix-turn-helix domain-containing protein n=1 Tax=uncultured Draconibacterium sp. TaxID=1573823 RepID=UPI0032166F3E